MNEINYIHNLMKLSILICTVGQRSEKLTALLNSIYSQMRPFVEVLYLGDNMKMSIGEKRNRLVEMARGEYVVFIDDDDRITEDYIDCLLKGIENQPDIVNFMVEYTHNGKEPRPVYYNANHAGDSSHGSYFRRIPNHLMCVRKSIAEQVRYKEANFGEDADYALRLKSHIKTQANIEKVLYYYDYQDLGSLAK